MSELDGASAPVVDVPDWREIELREVAERMAENRDFEEDQPLIIDTARHLEAITSDAREILAMTGATEFGRTFVDRTGMTSCLAFLAELAYDSSWAFLRSSTTTPEASPASSRSCSYTEAERRRT